MVQKQSKKYVFSAIECVALVNFKALFWKEGEGHLRQAVLWVHSSMDEVRAEQKRQRRLSCNAYRKA